MSENELINSLKKLDVLEQWSYIDPEFLIHARKTYCEKIKNPEQFKKSGYDYKAFSKDFCETNRTKKYFLFRKRSVYVFVFIDQKGKVECYIIDIS